MADDYFQERNGIPAARARLADLYARALAVQERLGRELLDRPRDRPISAELAQAVEHLRAALNACDPPPPAAPAPPARKRAR